MNIIYYPCCTERNIKKLFVQGRTSKIGKGMTQIQIQVVLMPKLAFAAIPQTRSPVMI